MSDLPSDTQGQAPEDSQAFSQPTATQAAAAELFAPTQQDPASQLFAEPTQSASAADLFGDDPANVKLEAGDAVDEEDLFGSDDDAPKDAEDLFGDAAPGGPDDKVGEEDLFGSEDEGLGGAQAEAQGEPNLFGDEESDDGAELDEKALFGENSDEEDGPHADDDEAGRAVYINTYPRPNLVQGVERKTLKLPNVLSIETTPYDPAHVDVNKLGFQELTDNEGRKFIRLGTAENTVRFRVVKDSEGNPVLDSQGRPHLESNTNIVEWEDGSMTLYVGKEAFVARSREDPMYLFDDRKDLKVFQGVVNEQMYLTPLDLESKTHERLKDAQINKIKSASKISLQIHGNEAEKLRMIRAGDAALEQRAIAATQAKRKAGPARVPDSIINMAGEAIQPNKRTKVVEEPDEDDIAALIKKGRK